MKHIYCLLCLFLLIITAAYAQTKAPGTRLNDLATSGYYGKVKSASKITWKNIPDSVLMNSGGFDSLYTIAERLIAKHFALLSTYFRQREKEGYIDVGIRNETFDTAGNELAEEQLMAANAENQTYKFGPYHAGKSTISITNNHSGAKSGTGYARWTGYNIREGHLALTNGFVTDDTLEITDNIPAKLTAMLRYKNAFIIKSRTILLSKTREKEVWLHTERTTTLYRKLPETSITDTITHNISERDSKDNILSEVVTHSDIEQKKETIFHQYKYYR
jgi:hypothetical protein